MSTNLYLVSLSLPFVTLLLIFGMRYFSVIRQAQLRYANDEAHRRLAEQAATAQAETASALHSITSTLTDVNDRLMKVEKVLKGIE
ncbi:hypothetical protein [Paenibacillus methanolicus]|uniref:Uncharacterized protein n=1 Tax=Paenibacillus methanolicus TaxID=582686 RepID=A0A5S5CHI5_9BACL|nr:hypothetical protein [Paenibacillus methanolicus]TYP79182.1 hypothetical protein BCM02_101298 [Paenibacillus methanolicus]